MSRNMGLFLRQEGKSDSATARLLGNLELQTLMNRTENEGAGYSKFAHRR